MGALQESVGPITTFFVERVAPLLSGRSARPDPEVALRLERQALEEIEARISRGRPPPSEWPASDRPSPKDSRRPRPAVHLSPEFRLRVVRMEVPLPGPAPQPASKETVRR